MYTFTKNRIQTTNNSPYPKKTKNKIDLRRTQFSHNQYLPTLIFLLYQSFGKLVEASTVPFTGHPALVRVPSGATTARKERDEILLQGESNH